MELRKILVLTILFSLQSCAFFRELFQPSDMIRYIQSDKIPPVITILSPSNSQEVGISFLLSGTVSDSGGSESVIVRFRLDEGEWQEVSLQGSNWSQVLNISGFGLHTIFVYAEDSAGNESEQRFVWVERTGIPSVILSLPIGMTYTNLTNLTVQGTSAVDAPYIIYQVQVRVNSGSWVNASGIADWSLGVILQEGTNLVEARALANNSRTNTDARLLYVTLPVPELYIEYYPGWSIAYGDNILLKGTASIPSPYSVTSVQVNLNGAGWVNASGTTHWTASLNLLPGPNTYQVRAIANDYKTNVSPLYNIQSARPYYGWAYRLGGSGYEYITDMAADPFGNIYIAGTFSGTVNFRAGWGGTDLKTSAGWDDIFVTKLDQDGQYQWTRRIGGLDYEMGPRLACSPAGNLYIAGTFSQTVDFRADWGGSDPRTSAGGNDCFVTKINADGSYAWTRRIGGSGEDEIKGICTHNAGTRISLTGSFENTVNFGADFGSTSSKTSAGFADVFVMQIEYTGDFFWVRRIGGVNADYPEDIVCDQSDQLHVLGNFYGTVDFKGDWGSPQNITSVGQSDIFITSINVDSTGPNTRRIGGTDYDSGRALAVDGFNHLYITGYFSGTVNFRAGWGGTDSFTSLGSRDIFVTKIFSSDTYSWTRQFGGDGGDEGHALALDAGNNLYLGGRFMSDASFSFPTLYTDWRSSAGQSDGFVLRILANGSYDWVKRLGGMDSDYVTALAVGITNNILYLGGGFANSVNFRDDWIGFDTHISAGNSDAFILRTTP